jgi:molybdopterin-containing oxidoreductase family membrane subunit
MWFERFVITVTSLANDFIPSSWGYYSPTVVDIFTFFGTFGVFSTLFLLFVRFLPLMALSEVKALSMPQADPHYRGDDHRDSRLHKAKTPAHHHGEGGHH